MRREHENLQNVLRDRQSQLDRSKEENGVLSETIRDLQQVIRMLEDDKNNDIHSVPQLQREIQTLKEENGRLTREKVRCLRQLFVVILLLLCPKNYLYLSRTPREWAESSRVYTEQLLLLYSPDSQYLHQQKVVYYDHTSRLPIFHFAPPLLL